MIISVVALLVPVRVDHHYGPVMEVSRQDPGLTEDPVNDCGHLGFALLHHLTLGEADIVPGGETSVEINVIGIESAGPFVMTTTLSLFTLFKAFKYRCY